MHKDMSCLERNTFTFCTSVDVSHKIIIAHVRHDLIIIEGDDNLICPLADDRKREITSCVVRYGEGRIEMRTLKDTFVHRN